jgi:hypothetical protein
MPSNEPSAFELRQRAFIERFQDRDLDELDLGTVVVIPSISFRSVELRKITGIEFYEERMLFTLLWLRRPHLRIVYVTSVEIDPDIIDYYLSFLEDPEHARSRLTLVSLGDSEPRALSSKLIERPDMLRAISRAIPDVTDAFMLNFNITEWERSLADTLDVALYGPTPELVSLGSKSGSRRVARRAGVPVLEGSEDLHSVPEMERAVDALLRRRPAAEAVVLKLNLGFSGQGNAIVNLDQLASPLPSSPTAFCAEEENWDSFEQKIELEGGIVEELVRASDAVSPSAQFRILPGGRVELVSTHDQILGGPDNQVYIGCRFPSGSAYRELIARFGSRVAEALSREGVIGSFGMDFIGFRDGNAYDMYLGEINLRLGGTTHPFQMARLTTEGTLHADTGELIASGAPIKYVATDNLKSDSYRSLRPADVIALFDKRGLLFDKTAPTGVTLHLLGALNDYGKLGMVCIARSQSDADELYNEALGVLDGYTS